MDICTGSGFSTTGEEKSDQDPTKQSTAAGGPSYLSYLAYNRNSGSIPADAASTAASTVKDKDKEKEKDKAKDVASANSSGNEPSHRRGPSTARAASVYSVSRASSPPPTSKLKPIVRKPSPRVYFVHFVDHPEHFVQFLEAIALARWGQKVDVKSGTSQLKNFSQGGADQAPLADPDADKQDRAAVWNTLIELYLTLSSKYLTKDPPDTEGSKSMQTKALHVLKSGFEYDPTHALLVCSTKQFTEGSILLWEKLEMYEDILRFYMDRENALAAGADIKDVNRPSVEVLRYLNRYGDTTPNLYPLVLWFLTSTPALLQRHTQELTRILEHIEEKKVMPPLAVVQVLSRNGVASVGLVKQWLMRRITDSKNDIESVSLVLIADVLLLIDFIRSGSTSHRVVS